MKKIATIFIVFAIGVSRLTNSCAASIAESFDAALAPHFSLADKPGAVVIVTKRGKTLFKKAYGLADLEHQIPLQADMIFRLGSMTKQFTAVAVLMLADEGKLSVKDEITKYLKDYPTQGRKITIEHLLTHTSGIKSYTDLPAFRDMVAVDKTEQQIIDLIKSEVLEFEPGEKFLYGNSGYFLLGVIIEKVAGMPYPNFMAKRIFEPLGMTKTAYEGYERTAEKRVQGYNGTKKAISISMTLPFSAGALVSTVDDLAKWNAAISAGQLLKPTTWKQAFTPYRLNKGAATNYGYGWVLKQFNGRETAMHDGAISGFLASAMRFPADDIYVAVLMNDERNTTWHYISSFFVKDNPWDLAQKAAEIALGVGK